MSVCVCVCALFWAFVLVRSLDVCVPDERGPVYTNNYYHLWLTVYSTYYKSTRNRNRNTQLYQQLSMSTIIMATRRRRWQQRERERKIEIIFNFKFFGIRWMHHRHVVLNNIGKMDMTLWCNMKTTCKPSITLITPLLSRVKMYNFSPREICDRSKWKPIIHTKNSMKNK